MIFPVDVRSLSYMMSRVTFDFVMSPVDSCETRLVHCDGFVRALPSGGGLSGLNYQLLGAFHEHHHHHLHDSVFTLGSVVVRSALFGCEARPFPSLSPPQPYSLA